VSDIEFTKAELHALNEAIAFVTAYDANYEMVIRFPGLARFFDVPEGPATSALATAEVKLDRWYMGDGEKEDGTK